MEIGPPAPIVVRVEDLDPAVRHPAERFVTGPVAPEEEGVHAFARPGGAMPGFRCDGARGGCRRRLCASHTLHAQEREYGERDRERSPGPREAADRESQMR